MHETIDFIQYLTAKRPIDDRALNRRVYETLANNLSRRLPQQRALRVLEVGAGIGTMVERLVAWDFFTGAVDYTGVDANKRCGETAVSRLTSLPSTITLHWETADVHDFVAQRQGQQWDLLIAHAFLDLVDLPTTLPPLFSLLPPGGLFWLTLNFDGGTIFQPVIDATLDAKIEAAYHATMNDRPGGPHTGRQLFTAIPAAGGRILGAGSSDWVVYADSGGYPANEAAFLHFILNTMQQALSGRPEVDNRQLARWIATRRQQIQARQLAYVAHQLDFVGRK